MVEIRDYNAAGDGITNDTAAVQAALDSGEVVHFTPGTYLCGTLYMRSNGGIHLDEGATLLAIPGKENYNADDFSPRNRVFVRSKTLLKLPAIFPLPVMEIFSHSSAMIK